MGFLTGLWDWLTTSARGRPEKGHPDLYPLDVDKLAKELRLEAEAKRLGEASLPAPEAHGISGPEAAIVQRVEKARQDYVDWANRRLNVISQDLGKRDVTQEVNRASQADDEFERKASALITEEDSVLRTAASAARSRKQELDRFRAEHGLTREARCPTGTGSFVRYAVLVFLVLIEGFANAGFFAQGLDTGLLGGFVQAGGLAAINVLIAFVLGKFAVPYVNHSNVLLKGAGLLALAASFLIMASIGLGIAHYRDALTLDAANPAQAALTTFLTNPVQLRDIFSWLLFVVSVTFALAAMFDGVSSDDPYPRYGKLSRYAQQAVDDHEDELNALRATLEELKNEELRVLDEATLRSQASVAVFESLINDKRMAGQRLMTAIGDADNSLDALLGKFRTENEIHRKGVPRPSYFDIRPELRPIQLPSFDVTADEASLRAQREQVKQLLAAVQEIRARIQAGFNQHFDQLKPLDIHFSSSEAS